MHRVMEHNQLFYCTNNEIVVGTMAKTNMDPIHAEVSSVYASPIIIAPRLVFSCSRVEAINSAIQ